MLLYLGKKTLTALVFLLILRRFISVCKPQKPIYFRFKEVFIKTFLLLLLTLQKLCEKFFKQSEAVTFFS